VALVPNNYGNRCRIVKAFGGRPAAPAPARADEPPDDPRFDREMDELGDAGWELVTARRASMFGAPAVYNYEVIIKRRR
jgi:hypothetical protein